MVAVILKEAILGRILWIPKKRRDTYPPYFILQHAGQVDPLSRTCLTPSLVYLTISALHVKLSAAIKSLLQWDTPDNDNAKIQSSS
jgi:hypothetical protein